MSQPHASTEESQLLRGCWSSHASTEGCRSLKSHLCPVVWQRHASPLRAFSVVAERAQTLLYFLPSFLIACAPPPASWRTRAVHELQGGGGYTKDSASALRCSTLVIRAPPPGEPVVHAIALPGQVALREVVRAGGFRVRRRPPGQTLVHDGHTRALPRARRRGHFPAEGCDNDVGHWPGQHRATKNGHPTTNPGFCALCLRCVLHSNFLQMFRVARWFPSAHHILFQIG